MTTSSQSAPGQFAAAIRKADPRSRAQANPMAPVTGIQHGHEGDPAVHITQPRAVESQSPLELLAPGRPRNADGTERAD